MFFQGKSVNYFVPPPPLERKTVCKSEVQPKMKISHPSMSLAINLTFSILCSSALNIHTNLFHSCANNAAHCNKGDEIW